MKPARILLGIVSCSMIVLTACGGTAGVAGVVDAGGTVTLDGKPVVGATVSFIPEGDGRNASALTDSNGEFELTTVHPGDGAIPGKYKVTVTKISAVADDSKPASQEEGMNEIRERMKRGGEAAMRQPPAKPKDELPPQYSKAETSGLTAEIQSSGGNDFPLELKTGG